MFVLGLSSGQSSSTDSLMAKKYFLRSSVIYSEARHVCDRLLLFPLAYPAAKYICVCALLTIAHAFLPLSLAARFAGVE